MSNYIKRVPKEPSFTQNGLNGYNFNLDCKDISISIEEVFKGHDKYHTNVHSTKVYYCLEGNGIFCINGEKIKIEKGEIIEILPNTEFVFAGKMKLLLIMSPAFREQDGKDGKDNDLYSDEL